MNESGLIHLYCGDGKGKTTAALGLALRASGAGKRVLLLQFLKGRETGELKSLARLPEITVVRGNASGKFSFQMDPAERAAALILHTENLRAAINTARAGECDLLILDEALGALSAGLLDERLLRELVSGKPPALELVLTGRAPPHWLFEAADYVSEMCKRKHPFDRGIAARSGVEF